MFIYFYIYIYIFWFFLYIHKYQCCICLYLFLCTVLDWNAYCFIHHQKAVLWSSRGGNFYRARVDRMVRALGSLDRDAGGEILALPPLEGWDAQLLDRNDMTEIEHEHCPYKNILPKWIELQKTGPFSYCVFFCIGFCWHHSVLFTRRILRPSLPRWFQRAMRDPAHFYKKWTVQRLIFVCDHDPPNLGYVVVHWMCRVERVRFDWGSNPLFFCFLFQNMFTVSLFNCFSLTKELYQTCWLFKIAFSEKMLLDSVQHAQNQPATCDLFQTVISSTQGSCLTF